MKKITKTGPYGIDLIKKFEGYVGVPYKCPAGVPTIGYGATHYADGSRVTMDDWEITQSEAEALLKHMLIHYETAVDSMTTDAINQHQFDALVSFAYNVGVKALQNSTLLKLVNKNPNDPLIAAQFARWNKAGGKVLAGLVRRRRDEASLYFKPMAG